METIDIDLFDWMGIKCFMPFIGQHWFRQSTLQLASQCDTLRYIMLTHLFKLRDYIFTKYPLWWFTSIQEANQTNQHLVYVMTSRRQMKYDIWGEALEIYRVIYGKHSQRVLEKYTSVFVCFLSLFFHTLSYFNFTAIIFFCRCKWKPINITVM